MPKFSSIFKLSLLITVSFTLSGCKAKENKQIQPEIAVANSYLQCVVQDLCGNQTEILSLVPPGMCPGHFDISPAQVNQLCKCRILLLFDFQKRIEDSLLRIKEKGLKIGSIHALPGLCVPETYLAACRDACNILSQQYPDRKDRLSRRLKLIEERLENLSNGLFVQIKRSGLNSAKVLASDHQAQFCNWLGLDVIATFVGSDIETVSNINRCIQKADEHTVGFIIANRQEGTALANALAERLGARTVVFSNFPETVINRDNFDRLLVENVQALLSAGRLTAEAAKE